MFPNRLCQSFGTVHLRRSVVSIYFHSYATNFNSKHNLSPVNKIDSNILSSLKCKPQVINPLYSPVRQFFSGVPDSLGEVKLLRGVRSDLKNAFEPPSPFQCAHFMMKLSKVLNQDAYSAIMMFTSGFEQAFTIYMELLRERNIHDLDRDWLQPSAQADTRDIINRLPENLWEAVESFTVSVPLCLGYQVSREESPPSVDAAFLYPYMLAPAYGNMFWHLVFTRKFGEGVDDSWTIKNVAVCPF